MSRNLSTALPDDLRTRSEQETDHPAASVGNGPRLPRTVAEAGASGPSSAVPGNG